MAILVSPGVDIQVIDESFYGTSGPGTVPLIIIATASNKAHPSGTGIAPGTLPENAGILTITTSQRDLIQTFGNPYFYTVQGTPQHGNELNEYGLHAAYQALGINNRAMVVRADIDLNQLIPSVFAPRAEALNGTYWLDTTESKWGIFASNGNSVNGLAWTTVSPYVIISANDIENVVMGNEAFALTTSDVITSNGTYVITINDEDVTFVKSGPNITLQTIVNGINSAAIENIKASTFKMNGLVFIMIRNTAGGDVTITGSTLMGLLGLTDYTSTLTPKMSIGVEGDFAVMARENDNVIFQKLTPKSRNGLTDSGAVPLWWIVGSDLWKQATPTVVTGSSSPILPLIDGDELEISDVSDNSTVTVSITFNSGSPDNHDLTTISGIVDAINDEIETQDPDNDLMIMAVVSGSAIKIVNYAGRNVYLHEPNTNSTQGVLASLGLASGLTLGNQLFYKPHTQIPSGRVLGDAWVKTTEPNNGADYVVKRYSRTTGQWSVVDAPLYPSDDEASVKLGMSSVSGTLYTQYNVYGTTTLPLGSSVLKRYLGNNPVVAAGDRIPGENSVPALVTGDQFVITISKKNTGSASFTSYTAVVTLSGTTLDDVVADINALSGSLPGISARTESPIQIINTNNLSMTLGYIDPTDDTDYSQTNSADPLASMGLTIGTYSNWEVLTYEASNTEPTTNPSEDTLWYNPDFQVDIMVGDGDEWKGYRNAFPTTDPNGAILAGSAPTTQTDGTPLVENDIWIDTTDTENYPKIYRWRTTSSSWESVDNTDQTTPFGVVFSDARANSDGTATGSTLIADMLVSNFLDPDAPDPRTYPDGMMLFNTRYSTYNVKQWKPNYFSAYVGQEVDTGIQYSVGLADFDTDTITSDTTGRWVTYSGNQVDGSPWMGRKAQRQVIIRAMAEVLASNQDIRAEANFFNLIACPGYPELIDEMVLMNTEKKEIATIVADTPARLKSLGADLQNWATNANVAPSNGDLGLTTRNTYVALYYPWGLSTNIDGGEVMIPPSTIALRTILYSDNVSYPWFAPAGFNRGLVTNASSVGYLSDEDEFVPVFLNNGQRDILYTNNINPIAFIPARGLVVFGQKTLHPTTSALDRVNVVRLINYLRYNLDLLAKPFLFEPNDKQTRDQVQTTFSRYLGNLIALRALYDYAVVVDETNNTPERIDRNELWIDIAIQPVKAIEYIYIPIRIRNTGEDLSTFTPPTA